MVEVADQVVEVDFQDGLMRLFLQFHADLLELEGTCAFQQYGLVVELREGEACQKVAHIGIEETLHVKLVGLARDAFTDTDECVDALVLQQLPYLGV